MKDWKTCQIIYLEKLVILTIIAAKVIDTELICNIYSSVSIDY